MGIILINFVAMLNNESIPGGEATGAPFCGVVDSQSQIEQNSKAHNGKKLFWNNCSSCHHKSMDKNATGPALAHSLERWNYDTLRLREYINDSEKFRSNAAFRKERPDLTFEIVAHNHQLSLESVVDIIEYINHE